MSKSEPDAESFSLSPELRRRRLRALPVLPSLNASLLAQAGLGCNLSYCRLKRLIYSLPSITSSLSVLRNFRSRVLEARETTIRSSSLSYQVARRDCPSWSSDCFGVIAALIPDGMEPGPESRKKS